jgi:hypothetical protein
MAASRKGQKQEGVGAVLERFQSSAGCRTVVDAAAIGNGTVPRFTNEFWTPRQRQASSIHEVSYRACFKPQLPRFFIDLLTQEGDRVYDPFSGRGTTAIEAALAGRQVAANDVNPLSAIMARPRLAPPAPADVAKRLETIPREGGKADIDLSMFYHEKTEGEIASLRAYLIGRREDGSMDDTDRWIAMVATNRLTGHSPGFFSVYTLPPNQAVSPQSQRRINRQRGQSPEYRDTHAIIMKKTKSLLRSLSAADKKNLARAGTGALLLANDARNTPEIADGSVQLTVTSPPFLDIVQYRADNWLRCWFNGLDADRIGNGITMARTMQGWSAVMGAVFSELHRIARPGGYVAFEVGEVRKRTVRLEEQVVPLGIAAGFACEGVLINQQAFTKTSNIWGVANNTCGTNTNRIVLFQRAE